MKSKIIVLFWMLSIQLCFSQTLDVGYLNPKLGSTEPYKFIRFGDPSNYFAGFMWNEAENSFGDGDDFSIFTYQNRDITFKTGTGNFIVFPSGGGNVGIGTKTPQSKLQIHGDVMIWGQETINGRGVSRLNWKGHSLVMGTKTGRYAHNVVEFKPGGSSSGELYSGLEFYQAIDENTHEKRIRIASANNLPTFFNGGNVGVGTNNPTAKLDVNGVTKVNSLSIDSSNPSGSVNNFSNRVEFINGGSGAIIFHPGEEDELMFGMHTNGNFYWGTGGNTASTPNYYSMYLDGDTGNLGIKGRLVSKEVKVDVDGWSDFVFEDTYTLPTLEEVEQHIQEKGHLKNIPSAKEVEENGIYLGEMDAKLLQKIEELTLYTIEQEKKIKTLEAKLEKVDELEKKLTQLINEK
ncbi:hypothetical protein OOZ15_11780 [Galbibacter sp. EGI 63066]|uniref:hypothetical protein n=1 Tax=Galbibacter sp. EGI 63066 TaxID=2993559 RepID=UPI002248B6EC|nr:hypothetical protein [Galbibacter sp. EGI 63066]MCX2680623.1 hypothetical protein [Galbibacter sp. EGI 63066]